MDIPWEIWELGPFLALFGVGILVYQAMIQYNKVEIGALEKFF